MQLTLRYTLWDWLLLLVDCIQGIATYPSTNLTKNIPTSKLILTNGRLPKFPNFPEIKVKTEPNFSTKFLSKNEKQSYRATIRTALKSGYEVSQICGPNGFSLLTSA